MFFKVNLCWIKFFEILVFLALLKLHSWDKIHFNKIFALLIMYRCETIKTTYTIKNRVWKNWYFQIVLLEKTLEIPLDGKEIKPVNPKGKQAWIFTGKSDAEVKAPILWPPDAKSWLIGKDLNAGENWELRRSDRGWDGWTASLTHGHEFEQTLGYTREAWCAAVQRVRHDLATEQQQTSH